MPIWPDVRNGRIEAIARPGGQMVAWSGTRNLSSRHNIEARVRDAVGRLTASPPSKRPRPANHERRKGWVRIGDNLSIRRGELADSVVLSDETKSDRSDRNKDRRKSEPD